MGIKQIKIIIPKCYKYIDLLKNIINNYVYETSKF